MFEVLLPGILKKTMSRLDDIREQLYRKQPDHAPPPPPSESPLPRTKTEGDVKSTWVPATLGSELSPSGQPVRKGHMLRDTLMIGGGLLLIAIGAWIGYTIYFPSAEVELSILGPSQITGGEAAVFTIRILNHSPVALREGSVTIVFPEGSANIEEGLILQGPLRMKLELPDVASGGEIRQDVRVRIFGMLGQEFTTSGVYLYRPDNIQSKLTRTADTRFTIARLPLAVTVDAPDHASSGQDYTITVGVDSELSQPLVGMSLGIEFPEGFQLKTADPAFPDPESKIWSLAELTVGTARTFSVTGTIRGDPGEVKSFHVRLGRYNGNTQQWFLLTDTTNGPIIAAPLLLVQTTLNGARQGSFGPGDRIDGNIFFKNNLPQKVENISILLSFPEKFVQLESVRGEHGFYDVTKQTLTWNPASESRLQELAPGEEGTLAFSFSLKSQLPIRTFSDKNFLFPVKTVIDTASVPSDYAGVILLYEDLADFKLESPIGISARATYYDSPIPNTGPLPPKVRRNTTYTVFLRLTSGANDLRDIEVSAALPGGVVWKGIIASDLGTIEFNPSIQELVWKVPILTAATGILRPPAGASIQVELTPAENQVHTSPVLVQGIQAEGRDSFTNTTQSASAGDITTELLTDKKSIGTEWRVQP